MSSRKEVLKLLAVNTVLWSVMALYSPFMGAFYTKQGITNTQIGMLSAVGPLAALFIQPFWGIISDKIGKRRNVLIFIVLGSSLAILTYRIHTGFLSFLVSTVLLTSFSTAIIPLCDAIVTNLTKKNRVNFAFVRIGGTVGYAITVFMVGILVKGNIERIFLFGCSGFLLLVFFLLLLPNEQAPKRERTKLHTKEKVFKNYQIRFVLLFAFLLQLGLTFCGTYYGVYVIKLGFSASVLGISSCISALSEIPVLLLINKLMKKFGAVNLLAFSVAMVSLRLILAASGVLPLMLMSQLLQSVTYMTCYYSCVMFISENAAEGKLSQGQSMLAMVQTGLGSTLGSLLGGTMTEHFGIGQSFLLLAAAIAVISVLNFFLLYIDGKRRRVQKADVLRV